jgi:hypothetical protein
MKPFNLEAALRGEPVVTRDGRLVKIAGYNPNAFDNATVLGWVGREYSCWYSNGTYLQNAGHKLDLFMAPKPKVKREGWVKIAPDMDSKTIHHGHQILTSYPYFTKELCDESGFEGITARIEWEEEVP